MPREYKQFYRRKLPHRHSPGGTLFVTFRLAGSIPISVIQKYKDEKFWLEKQAIRAGEGITKQLAELQLRQLQLNFHRKWFKRFEDVLHDGKTGPTWLKDPAVARILADSLHFLNGKSLDLIAFSIMSNHAHTVFRPLLDERSLIEISGSGPLRFETTAPTLGSIMDSLKGYTARQANKVLLRKGKFWESESYDHEIRTSESMARIVRYVLNNPVKAGLVKDWRDWPWNWRAW
jgi:REP element-mobilizing transposase RayT